MLGLATALLPLPAVTAQAAPVSSCEASSKEAIAEARRAIATPSHDDDRTALMCLAEAVAALDAKLESLRDGSLPFTGTIYAPKGVVMKKPPAREGR
jgi:hypothetical protein